MEDGEIADDDVLIIVDGDRGEDNYDDVNMELGSDSETTSLNQRSASQTAVDEAEELRELLLSQVNKKKRLDKRSSTLSGTSLSKRSNEKRNTHQTDHSTQASSLLPLPPPPMPPDSFRSTSRSHSRESHSHSNSDCKKVEEGLDEHLKQIEELKERFASANSKYEMARKRKRDYLESIAQCDATLAKYQRTMESLWEAMMKLSAEATTTCLKGIKKIKSGHSKLNKTVKEQRKSIEEKDDEIRQLNAKNQLLESIIRKEEAAVQRKRRRTHTSQPRIIPLSPIYTAGDEVIPKEPTPESPASNSQKENAVRIIPTEGPTQSLQSTSWRRASQSGSKNGIKQPTLRYFHVENSSLSAATSAPTTTHETPKQPAEAHSTHSPTTTHQCHSNGRRVESGVLRDESTGDQQVKVSSSGASNKTSKQFTTTSNRPAPPHVRHANVQAATNGTHRRVTIEKSSAPLPMGNGTLAEELKSNPLALMLNSYRLSRNFPFHLIRHPAVTNRIDPLLPLCPYMLNGRCADYRCPWQHDNDYQLGDEEIVNQIISAASSAGFTPNDATPQDVYVSQQLRDKSLEEVVRSTVSRLPASYDFTSALCNGGAALSAGTRLRRPVPESADEAIDYDRVELEFGKCADW